MSVNRYDVMSYSLDADGNSGPFVKYDDYAALEARCAALAAESEERRQFIINGVEFGYIRLPDEDTADSAKAIYELCLSVGKYTPCQKCNDTGMTDSGGTQTWGEPIEIECDCLAAQIRKEHR
ncbi:hypothetical protein G9451_04400 [Enterobacter kobei]|uniref:hypothetical protein n=1 Tax=Enterobacter kobei TaxID=208224 RepID=UPI00187FCC25|nr:hypothetical protein [Enterobacter kobei]MBE8915147.1 hypothetical protein [Enterobacter kobei]